MKLKLLAIFCISALFTLNCTYALDEKKVVRVAISNQSFSNFEFNNIKLISSDTIKITDMLSNSPIEDIEPNTTVEITLINTFFSIYINDELKYEKLQGPLVISSNSPIGIVDLNRKGTPAKYFGMIELKKTKNQNTFNIVNSIDMKNYLRGVVPNEMPVSFGIEALKAQAVAARNYVQNASISPNYDVVDSTASQVYYGANSYRDISDLAVEKTSGIYALYNSKPIMALYFSTSPGMTDDWDDVFATNQNKGLHPYLKSRPDFEYIKPLKTEQDVVEFYSGKKGLDINSPKFRWSVEFTREELEDVLNTTLKEQSKAGLVEPSYDGTKPIQGLKEIKPIKRTQSGKIVELEIIAHGAKYKVKKELGIRRVFKKNNSMLASANFFVEVTEQEKPVRNKSEKIQITKTQNDKPFLIKLFDKIEVKSYPAAFKFTGGGFGHGVGMSQFGAYNLAKKGKKYPEILKHYYTDIKLSTLPKKVEFSQYDISYKTEFYYDKTEFKQIYLIIDNPKNISDCSFKINDMIFEDTKELSKNRFNKIDITGFLNQGINIIDFTPLTYTNKGKYIEYRVEFI